MTYGWELGFWTSLIVTNVSSVECFINQKDLIQFPKFLSRFQCFSFRPALQSFNVNKVSFCWTRLATIFLGLPIFYNFGVV